MVTWGLGRIQTIATPLDRRNATISLGGLVVFELWSHLLIGSKPNQSVAKESVAKQQLKHRHLLSIAQNVTWGFFAVETNKESTLVMGYQARLGSQVYAPKTPD